MTATLHPRGTLRARFEPVANDVFRRLGIGARSCDLGDEGLYLAEELVAADAGWLGSGSSDQAEALAILVLALMIVQRQGSTRLRLDVPRRAVTGGSRHPLRALVADIARLAGIELDIPRILRTITNLTSSPRFNSVIGMHAARLPLVVDRGCLYTERARWLEDRVAARLAERIAVAPRTDVETTAAEVSAFDPARPLSAEQQHAVAIALANRLAVITGGPGTGKTLVAAAIVRGLSQLGIAPITLAAQTGKAANRLNEVLAEQQVAATAQTLHRLLGYRGGRFTHDRNSPLPVGAVIVDEASMIDLELVDALLDALPLDAPLILIGDAHQLPAIDAGQVLADLTTEHHGDRDILAVLATSYRQNTADPAGRAVFEAARAIHEGEPGRLTGRLRPRDPDKLMFRGVEWVDTAAAPRPHDVTLATAEAMWLHLEGPRALRAGERVFRFVDGVIDPAQRAELEALWSLLGRGRILTVTRSLATGSIAINRHLHQLALDRMSVSGQPEFVPGEPVMVTANDYHRGLFNGDQGIVVRVDEGLGKHHYRAVFRSGGELRPFAIEALRDRLELAWALTIHKSQGSELDAVAILLPHDDLPLVTRELLYTGITRARSCVTIAGSRPVLASGARRVAQRDSGLGARLQDYLAADGHDRS